MIVHRLLALILLIIDGPLSSLCSTSSSFTQLYVVPFPSLVGNNSDGSLAYPYSSLQQALDHIERDYYKDFAATRSTTINLYPTHHFVKTIRFGQAHSHTRLTTMSAVDTAVYTKLAAQEHTHRRLPTASISGGVPITGWTHVSGNTYSAVVPSLAFVNQLFINNQRIVRTRVPTNYSDYLQYAASLKDSTQARYGFQYMPGQFDYKSLADAMVVVYHSWTESHHYIDRLITTNNTILFTNPSDKPIGTYVVQGQRRFHIENLCEALVSNSFCFVNETKTVYLMTNGSYDPTKVEIITSVNDIVVKLASDDVYHPVEDVIIDNVAIQHSAWNIDRTQQADGAAAAFLNFAAFFVANASCIVMSNVEISHTGAYGLWINTGTSDLNLVDSLVTDTGAGGIWIGRTLVPIPRSASFIKIISNEISYGGNVFPCGVGIVINSAEDARIVGNSIHHHRYNGISVGTALGYGHSWTKNALILGNYIYNIGRHVLCDQGGIYTIGVQPGAVIHGNVVKNVFSYAIFMWGIYLDEGSSDLLISNNVVYNTGWASLFQHYGANNTIMNNVFARASLFPPPQSGDSSPDGDVHIQLAENHTSWTFTRNIVYDTFQGTNHSAYKSNPNVTALFSNNIYYNPYGTQLLFGSQQMLFADWQKSGQDNGSVIADPLFAGNVNQCDFFTLQPNSPAAKLGFVNITKPMKWIPGCEMDDGTTDDQFYHW
jgi:parallel beta-helix repeat protein